MPIVKNLAFGDEAREKLITGISKIANAVKSTLGPRGKTVLMESENHTGGLTITKDGITVAKSITLEDPIENLAVQLLRQASDLTAVQAGDGTSTAIVLTQALVLDAQERIKPSMNQTVILRHLRTAADTVLNRLKASAIPITDENLVSVATISANGDESLGKMIADAYLRTGLRGTVLTEKSKTPHSYSEITNGMRIQRGWTSKYFITNQAKQECVLENPLILVCDKKIENLMSIKDLVAPCIDSNGKGVRPFLIIGEVSDQCMEAMNFNTAKGICQFGHILSPAMGFRGSEMMEDIAIATGARYFSEGSGDNFEMITVSDLGTAKKVIISTDNTIIIPVEDDDIKLSVGDRMASLEQIISEETDVNLKTYYKERLSNLTGSIAVAYIGAVSDIEYKELKDRADDCTSAVAAAIDGGVLPGGGLALRDIAFDMKYGDDESGRVAWHILRNALISPFTQILINGGFDPEQKAKDPKMKVRGTGFDVANGEFVNLIEAGIIDPAKVTMRALDNAVSVASTIMSTNCIITNARAK